MNTTNINGAGVYTLHATDKHGSIKYYTVLISGHEPFLKFDSFYCHEILELVNDDILRGKSCFWFKGLMHSSEIKPFISPYEENYTLLRDLKEGDIYMSKDNTESIYLKDLGDDKHLIRIIDVNSSPFDGVEHIIPKGKFSVFKKK